MRRLAFVPGEQVVGDSLYTWIASGEVAVQLASNGIGGEGRPLGAGELLLPGEDAGAPGCTARSEVVLYRIDDGTLTELLAGPELAAGLAAVAAVRAAHEVQAGRSSAPAAGHRAAEPAARLIQRLFGRR